jgi:hypothetical protein
MKVRYAGPSERMVPAKRQFRIRVQELQREDEFDALTFAQVVDADHVLVRDLAGRRSELTEEGGVTLHSGLLALENAEAVVYHHCSLRGRHGRAGGTEKNCQSVVQQQR